MNMVTLENYEAYIISYIDGELNAAELQELEAFMVHHPELRSEMTAYENTRLLPDTTVVYANKEALLKKAPKRSISLSQWRSYGAAAGIIALIGTAILLWQHTDNHVTTVVKVTTNKNTIQSPVNPITHENPVEDTAMQQPVMATVTHRNRALPGNTSVKHTNRPTITDYQPITPPSQEKTTIDKPIEIAKTAVLPEPKAATIDTIVPVKVQSPATTMAPEAMVANTQEEKDPFAWLPIDDTRKQGLKDLKKRVDKTVKEVRTVTTNLKETALVFKFGKKEITLNF